MTTKEECLITAVKNNDIKMVESLFKKNILPKKIPSPDTVDDCNRSALSIATYSGFEEMVRILLDKGALPNFATEVTIDKSEKRTIFPLLIAAQKNFPAIIKLLVQGKANINKKNNVGETALYLAAQEGNLEATKELIRLGAKCLPNSDNATPIFIAAQEEKGSVLEELLKAYSSLKDFSRNDGTTPVFIASQLGKIVALRKLLASGASPNIPDKKGNTPLSVAAYQGHQIIFDILLTYHGDIRAVNQESGQSPLHFAVSNEKPKMVSFLLKKQGLSIDLPTKQGLTALHIAVQKKNRAIVSGLLEAGANVKVLDNNNHNPLYYAVVSGDQEITRRLCAKGAVITDELIILAEEKKHYEVANFLRQELVDQSTKNRPVRVSSAVIPVRASSSSTVADEQPTTLVQWAAELEEKVKKSRTTGMLQALSEIKKQDPNTVKEINDIRKTVRHLMYACAGIGTEELAYKYKQVIMACALFYIYVLFLKAQALKQSCLTEETRQIYVSKIEFESEQLNQFVRNSENTKKTSMQNDYQHQLDMMKIVLDVLFDPDRDKKLSTAMFNVFKSGFLGINATMMIGVKSGAETGGAVVSSVGAMMAGGVRMPVVNPLSHLPAFKYPGQQAVNIVKELMTMRQMMRNSNDVVKYIDCMSMYLYGHTIAVDASSNLFDEELLPLLTEAEKKEWHILYAGIQALYKIIKESGNIELQIKAFQGADEVSGLVRYLTFGDNAHLAQSTNGILSSLKNAISKNVTDNHSWRIREAAVKICILLYDHPNKQISETALKLLLDRKIKERDVRVQRTLRNPRYVLEVQREIDAAVSDVKAVDNVDDQLTDLTQKIKTLWHKKQGDYQKDLKNEQETLVDLKEKIKNPAETVENNEELHNSLEEKAQDVRASVENVLAFVTEIGELEEFLTQNKETLEKQNEELDKLKDEAGTISEEQKKEQLVLRQLLSDFLRFKQVIAYHIGADKLKELQQFSSQQLKDASLLPLGPLAVPTAEYDSPRSHSSSESVSPQQNSPMTPSAQAVIGALKTISQEGTVEIEGMGQGKTAEEKRAQSYTQKSDKLQELSQYNINAERNRGIKRNFESRRARVKTTDAKIIQALLRINFLPKNNSVDFGSMLKLQLKDILLKCVAFHQGTADRQDEEMRKEDILLKSFEGYIIPEAYMRYLGGVLVSSEKIFQFNKVQEFIDELLKQTLEVVKVYSAQLGQLGDGELFHLSSVFIRRFMEYVFKEKVKREELKTVLVTAIGCGKDWTQKEIVLETKLGKQWSANTMIETMGLYYEDIPYLHAENDGSGQYGFRNATKEEFCQLQGSFMMSFSLMKKKVESEVEKDCKNQLPEIEKKTHRKTW